MKDWLPYLISAGALVLAVVNAVYTRRRDAQGDLTKKFGELGLSVEDFGRRLVILETQVSVFWKGVSYSSAQALHSPHTPELDLLLEKFGSDKLRDERDIARLKTILLSVADTDPDALRRKLAHDILTLIQIRYEIGGLKVKTV